MILGVVLAVLGVIEQYKAGAIIAVVTALPPWILSFNGVSAALWAVLLLSIAFALLAGYQGWFAKKEET